MNGILKKVFVVATVAALIAALAVGLAACNPDGKEDGDGDASVTVKYYADGAAVQAALTAGQIDYGIVGEPAATAGQGKGFSVVMDLQSEFDKATGGTSGFPMSSTFVKSELAADKTFVDAFLAVLEDNLDYVSAHASEMTALLRAAGSASAYPAASVPKCNVGVYMDDALKATVADMLATLNSVSNVPDSVYYDEAAATEQGGGSGTLELYVPDGAPVLAVAKLIAEADTLTVAGYKINVNIVSATEIAGKIATRAGDIVIMPANGGANLVVKGAPYKFLCSNTKGILYMISDSAGTVTPADLKGKTVGCIGQGAVPQYAFEKILSASGLTVEK